MNFMNDWEEMIMIYNTSWKGMQPEVVALKTQQVNHFLHILVIIVVNYLSNQGHILRLLISSTYQGLYTNLKRDQQNLKILTTKFLDASKRHLTAIILPTIHLWAESVTNTTVRKIDLILWIWIIIISQYRCKNHNNICQITIVGMLKSKLYKRLTFKNQPAKIRLEFWFSKMTLMLSLQTLKISME